MTDEAINVAIGEFESKRATLLALAEKSRTLADEILQSAHIRVHAVHSRVKSRGSLIAKLKRTDRHYLSLDEITDMVGLRIITYFHDDVDRVAEHVCREFAIDVKNSSDRRDSPDPDRFGYASLHYVAEISQGRLHFPEYRLFSGFKIEIQIRSLLQHTWAELEHDLGYKTAAGIPRDLRRRFARLSGLLELADSEFGAIRTDLAEYEAAIESRVLSAPETVRLDKPSLVAFLSHSVLPAELDRALVETVGASLDPSWVLPIESHVVALNAVGIRTIGDLASAIRERKPAVVMFAAKWLKASDFIETPLRLAPTVGLIYLAYQIAAESGSSIAIEAVAGRFHTFRDVDFMKRLSEIHRELLETAREGD